MTGITYRSTAFQRNLIWALLLFSTAAHVSADQISINGQVSSVAGLPLENSEVEVNGHAAGVDAAGRFTATLDPYNIYTVTYRAAGHYTMIHSFSAYELSLAPSSGPGSSLMLPDVQLVQQTDNRVMLAFAGDTMMGRRYFSPLKGEPVLVDSAHTSADATALLQHIGPYLKLADYTSVNLETQVFEQEFAEHAPKSVVFHSPPELLGALTDQGVDYVSLGNNHTFDYLETGLKATFEALQTTGLGVSGAGLTEDDALQGYQFNINGNRLSYLAYVGWEGGFEPNQVARGTEKGGAAFGSSSNIASSVAAEIAQGFAPVVQYHGGLEYSDGPTLVVESRLKQAIDEGAVLALAHHPHVAQGFELYKDKLIAYSLGNFLFDQYHYATQFSFLLYVWMDQGQFYRAEVVPVHIKGYTPLPATDSSRQLILKRISDLSAGRGLILDASGGNAVISRSGENTATRSDFEVPLVWQSSADSVYALDQRAWNEGIDRISIPTGLAARYRLGRNFLPTGHFESYDLYDSVDRTWISDGSQQVVQLEQAVSGNHVMRLAISAERSNGVVGMRTFERTFKPGSPSSIVAKIKTDAALKVTAYIQTRKTRTNRLEALESAPLREIGNQTVEPMDWQQLRFDFDTARIGVMSYRFILKISPEDTTADTEVFFDDIALVQWMTAPLDAGELPVYISTIQASHIGIEASENE